MFTSLRVVRLVVVRNLGSKAQLIESASRAILICGLGPYIKIVLFTRGRGLGKSVYWDTRPSCTWHIKDRGGAH